MYKLLNKIFVILSLTAVVLADLPKGIRKCHKEDSDCIKQTIQEVLKNYPGGLREFNLLPLDPLHVKNLALDRNPSSPVNLDLQFTDLDLIGLQTADVTSVKGLNLGQRNVFEAILPEFKMKGKYVANGRVLILPITGKGDCVITSKNIHLKYSFDLKPVDKNGKIYSQIEHVKLEFNPEHVHYQLGGLFNNDKALGDSMNTFLNDNWQDIYKEMQKSMSKALGLVCKQIINNILGKYEYEELFL